jgi:hypothetical protein
MWSSNPSVWVLAASVADIAIVSLFALFGILMEPLGWHIIVGIFAATVGFALIFDQIKLLVSAKIKIE